MTHAFSTALVSAGLLLSACASMPVDQAEQQCLAELRNAPVRDSGAGTFRSPINIGLGYSRHGAGIGLGVGPGGPTANIGVGASSRHHGGRVSAGVSTDNLLSNDPSKKFDRCVFRKSGRTPSQPLYTRTDWKG